MLAGVKLASGSSLKEGKRLSGALVSLFVLTFLCWQIYEQIKKR